jgi:hypothetical protein
VPVRFPAPTTARVLALLLLPGSLGGCENPLSWDRRDQVGDAGPDLLRRDCTPDNDPDGDTIATVHEGIQDQDGDGLGNAFDDDSDGDGIPDEEEAGDRECLSSPIDSDLDGVPDFLDLDSDDDGIDDATEGLADPDEDGVPAFRDRDADGDGLPDDWERGIAPSTTARLPCPYFLNPDGDGDGLSDGEERFPPAGQAGTDPCRADTDGDGLDDLPEVAWTRAVCTGDAPRDCDCPRDGACAPLVTVPYVELPAGERDGATVAASRSLVVGLDVRFREVDLLFLVDVSRDDTRVTRFVLGRMFDEDGLLAQVEPGIRDLAIGLAEHSDFPIAPYGGADDVPFRLRTPVTPVPPEGADRDQLVATLTPAFDALTSRFGGDRGGAHGPALEYLATGDPRTFFLRDLPEPWVFPDGSEQCPDARVGLGGACFRPGALPLVVHASASCPHGGPAAGTTEDNRDGCGSYRGVAPRPATVAGDGQATDALRRLGARYVGVNAAATPCGGEGGTGASPCPAFEALARGTATVEPGGQAVIAEAGARTASGVRDAIAQAITRALTGVPVDAVAESAVVRTDPDRERDGSRLGAEATPVCTLNGDETCWLPPSGVAPADAVGTTDLTTFFGALPGTRVFVYLDLAAELEPRGIRSRTFLVHLTLATPEGARLDTARVLVAVPGGG